jgi:biofilm PGA synthesis protein PgaD
MTLPSRPLRRSAQWLPGVFITGLFWMVWLYLVLPLVSLLLWVFGVQLFMDEILAHGGYQALLRELSAYGVVVLVMLVAILLWVVWNVRHYGRHEMRIHQPLSTADAEISGFAGIPLDTVHNMQQARFVTIAFDERDRPVPEFGAEKQKAPLPGPLR